MSCFAFDGVMIRDILGEVVGTLADVSQNFLKLVDVFFPQKPGFFRNFRNVSTNNTPKITFFEFFGKFVNKNAIKSDFWGVVCRYISKISKKIPDFGQKVFLHRAKF